MKIQITYRYTYLDILGNKLNWYILQRIRKTTVSSKTGRLYSSRKLYITERHERSRESGEKLSSREILQHPANQQLGKVTCLSEVCRRFHVVCRTI